MEVGRVPGACCLAVFLAAADAAATDAVGMSDNDSDFEDQDDVYSQFMQRAKARANYTPPFTLLHL